MNILIIVIPLISLVASSSAQSNDTESSDASPKSNETDTEKRFGFFGLLGNPFNPWAGERPTVFPGNFNNPGWNDGPQNQPQFFNSRPNENWPGPPQGPVWDDERPNFPDFGRPQSEGRRPGGRPQNPTRPNQGLPQFPVDQGQGRPNTPSLPVAFENDQPSNIRPWEQPEVVQPWSAPNNPDIRPVTEDTFETSPPNPVFFNQQVLAEASDPAAQEQPTNDFREIFFGSSSQRPSRQTATSIRPFNSRPVSGPVTFPTSGTGSTRQTTFRPPRTTRTTAQSMINLPEATTSVSPCELRCQATLEFNPVCGTDSISYNNPGKLKCAQRCGKNVSVLHYGNCIVPVSTTSEPLRTW